MEGRWHGDFYLLFTAAGSMDKTTMFEAFVDGSQFDLSHAAIP